MYGILYPRADVRMIYLKRKERGSRMVSAEDCISMEKLGLNDILRRKKTLT